MVLWRQDSHVNRYVKYSENLKDCRNYIAGHKYFKTYKGIPLITYELKNGETFNLPVLDDFIDDYDYNVVTIDFIFNKRTSIFGVPN